MGKPESNEVFGARINAAFGWACLEDATFWANLSMMGARSHGSPEEAALYGAEMGRAVKLAFDAVEHGLPATSVGRILAHACGMQPLAYRIMRVEMDREAAQLKLRL